VIGTSPRKGQTARKDREGCLVLNNDETANTDLKRTDGRALIARQPGLDKAAIDLAKKEGGRKESAKKKRVFFGRICKHPGEGARPSSVSRHD